jgi:hypothetical protein
VRRDSFEAVVMTVSSIIESLPPGEE